MNEWMFLTSDPNGLALSIDGRLPKEPITVQDICTGDGWDIEHSALHTYDDGSANWHLILSRPIPTARPHQFGDGAVANAQALIGVSGEPCDGRR